MAFVGLALGFAPGCMDANGATPQAPEDRAAVIEAIVSYRVGYLRDHEAKFLVCSTVGAVGDPEWTAAQPPLISEMLSGSVETCAEGPETVSRGTARVRVDSISVAGDTAQAGLTVFVPNGTFREEWLLLRTRMGFVVNQVVLSRFTAF